MSKKLLLTAAGFKDNDLSSWRKELVDGFKNLLGKDLKDLKCAFIPTAADPEEEKWFVNTARQEIVALGMDLIEVDLKNSDKLSIRKNLEKSDVIYVNGGNTFYLLDQARKSGFADYLEKLLGQGKVYVGVSAGSILVGPDIEIAGWDQNWDKNVINLTDTRGLNIVPFVVSPHFTESERAILETKGKNMDYQIIAITDQQAVIVEDSGFELIGAGDKINLKI